jgi:hypothetical protein
VVTIGPSAKAEPEPEPEPEHPGKRQPPPPPLVRFFRHPIRWTRNKVELLAAAVVLAHIGMLIIVALYYLIFELNPTVTHWWHGVVSNSDLRHSIRDVSEGVLGGFLAQAIVWNHYTRGHQKAGRRIERLQERLHLPAPVIAMAGTILLAAAGFAIAYYVLHALHAHAAAGSPKGSFWSRSATIWKYGWDKKIMGYGASLIARRPLFVVFDSIQRWFAERRVDLGKPLRWYHPPTFKARYNGLKSADHPVERHPAWQTVPMLGGLVVGIGLAGYGYYVLTYVA